MRSQEASVRALLGAQRLQLVRVGFLGLERVPQQVQMDADDPVGPGTAELPGYGRSPVAALYPVPCVAQTRHQLAERRGHPVSAENSVTGSGLGFCGARRLGSGRIAAWLCGCCT
jgi:hypothetical protein